MDGDALVVKSLCDAMELLPLWDVASTEEELLLPGNDVGCVP